METILPRITYQFRKDFQAAISEIRDFGAHLAPYPFALDGAVEGIQRLSGAHCPVPSPVSPGGPAPGPVQ